MITATKPSYLTLPASTCNNRLLADCVPTATIYIWNDLRTADGIGQKPPVLTNIIDTFGVAVNGVLLPREAVTIENRTMNAIQPGNASTQHPVKPSVTQALSHTQGIVVTIRLLPLGPAPTPEPYFPYQTVTPPAPLLDFSGPLVIEWTNNRTTFEQRTPAPGSNASPSTTVSDQGANKVLVVFVALLSIVVAGALVYIVYLGRKLRQSNEYDVLLG